MGEYDEFDSHVKHEIEEEEESGIVVDYSSEERIKLEKLRKSKRKREVKARSKAKKPVVKRAPVIPKFEEELVVPDFSLPPLEDDFVEEESKETKFDSQMIHLSVAQ